MLDICFNVTVNTFSYGNETKWSIGNCKGEGYQDNDRYIEQCCLHPGYHVLICEDTFGDGWHGGFIHLNDEIYCEDFRNGHKHLTQVNVPTNNGKLKVFIMIYHLEM